jgi:hypothetical protein
VSALPALHVDHDLFVTAHGYERLCADREDCDPDNPMLLDLLEEQAQLDGRISALESADAAERDPLFAGLPRRLRLA